MLANSIFELLTIVSLCFFATVWFGIWAIWNVARRRSATRDLETRFQQLLEQNERQKKDLIDTVLHYDTRIEQIEQRLAELERDRFTAGVETSTEARIRRSES
ncbi:MAG: hypothetical protein HY320_16360 [Armatimonadetes bacterium]|nr:hypothetical protein [Armatimonadota bacterium]